MVQKIAQADRERPAALPAPKPSDLAAFSPRRPRNQQESSPSILRRKVARRRHEGDPAEGRRRCNGRDRRPAPLDARDARDRAACLNGARGDHVDRLSRARSPLGRLGDSLFTHDLFGVYAFSRCRLWSGLPTSSKIREVEVPARSRSSWFKTASSIADRLTLCRTSKCIGVYFNRSRI